MEVGSKVILMEGWLHYMNDKVYPMYGTTGTIVRVSVDRSENPEKIAMIVGSGDLVEVQWDGMKMNSLVFESQLQVVTDDMQLPTALFEVGDKVRYNNKEHHRTNPDFYPPVGTLGTVEGICGADEYIVKWKKGSTSGDDTWLVNASMITMVKAGKLWKLKR